MPCLADVSAILYVFFRFGGESEEESEAKEGGAVFILEIEKGGASEEGRRGRRAEAGGLNILYQVRISHRA